MSGNREHACFRERLGAFERRMFAALRWHGQVLMSVVDFQTNQDCFAIRELLVQEAAVCYVSSSAAAGADAADV